MPAPNDKDARQRRLEVERRFASRYEAIAPGSLAAGEEWSFDRPETALFLGTYSAEGMRHVLATYGFDRLLAERGIERWSPEVDTSDPFLHVLRLREEGGAVFCELRARTALGRDIGIGGDLADLDFYVIEWLSIEDPHRSFAEKQRPPLPGQRRPGLGLAAEVEEVLVLGARRVGSAALVSRPNFFHNAVLYHPRWMFVDPAEEGRFAAIFRDLGHLSLPRLAWAVHLGCVSEHGKPFEWHPGPMVLPRTRPAFRHFEGPLYRARRVAARLRARFELDEAALEKALAEKGLAI